MLYRIPIVLTCLAFANKTHTLVRVGPRSKTGPDYSLNPADSALHLADEVALQFDTLRYCAGLKSFA